MTNRLLIVDDEPNVLYSFAKALRGVGREIFTAETASDGIRLVQREHPDVVILDVRLPDMSGLAAFDRIREIDPRLPVIVVTAYSTSETAIDAMKRGALEYLLKPVDVAQLRSVVAKAMELSRLRHVPAIFGEPGDEVVGDRIVGRSSAMQEIYKTVGRVAAEDVTVLILGESGTGKELIARAIYQHSRRSEKPFLAINCAALPEPLLESELFGHERGAFTGAERRRIGKFEQAHGGTILLDELGDMSTATQAKVLRVLQDGRFERLGGNETIQTDVRVLAATNQDLEAKIAVREFRHDLLYRLNGFTIRVPPLRDRVDDLPALVDHLLKLSNQEVSKSATSLTPETMEVLRAYDWPGNVRELQSVIKFAVVHAVGEVITPDCLPETCRPGSTPSGNGHPDPAQDLAGVTAYVRQLLENGETEIYRRLQAEVDRLALAEALRYMRGNQVHTSERLGIARSTLRSKLAQLDLHSEDF